MALFLIYEPAPRSSQRNAGRESLSHPGGMYVPHSALGKKTRVENINMENSITDASTLSHFCLAMKARLHFYTMHTGLLRVVRVASSPLEEKTRLFERFVTILLWQYVLVFLFFTATVIRPENLM